MGSKKSNGFMVFTMEWKNKQKGEVSLQTAVNEAGKLWAVMTPQQRGPYKERSKKEAHIKERELRNCNGIPISQINREIECAKNRELQMQRYIDNHIRRSLNKSSLQNQTFHFIMFNYFTKTLDGGQYIPAEVAVCRYSLEDGKMDLYSSLLDPGIEIFGNSYDAISHAESTHQLPLPPDALGNNDLAGVYCKILQFLEKGNAANEMRGTLPPVYTFNEHVPVIESCLSYLNKFAPDEPQLSVYSIHYLFYKLKSAACELAGIAPPKSIYITNAQFDRDFFEYQTGIACEYHEKIDRTKYCAQSRVVRWSYTFSDYICKDLDVDMMPGKHFPKNVSASFVVNDPNGNNSTWNSSIASSKFKSAESSICTSVHGDENDIDTNSSHMSALSLNSTVPTSNTSSLKPSKAIGIGWRPKIVSTDFQADLNGNDFPDLSGKKKSKKPTNRSAIVADNSVWKMPTREPSVDDLNITQYGSDVLSDLSINTSFVSGRGRGRAASLSSTRSSVDRKNSLLGIDSRNFNYN